MNGEELIKEACKNLGCDESIICFGGEVGNLCREVILECRKIRTKEMEHEAWLLSEKAKGENCLGHANHE